MPRPVHSHFVDYDQPGERHVRALCGVLVARKDAVAQPTCAKCAELRSYQDRQAADLAAGIINGVDTRPHPGGCQCRACFDAWLRNARRHA